MYRYIHIHTCVCVCARVRVLYIYVYARMHDLEVLLHMIKMIQADEDLQVPERFFFYTSICYPNTSESEFVYETE